MASGEIFESVVILPILSQWHLAETIFTMFRTLSLGLKGSTATPELIILNILTFKVDMAIIKIVSFAQKSNV